MLKKIVMLLWILSSLCFSAGEVLKKEYAYLGNYAQAVEQSIKTGRPMMVLFVTKVCPWCKKLEKQTLKKAPINTMIQSHFIPVILDKESDLFPKELDPPVVPTIHFIKGAQVEPFDTIYGYKSTTEFMELLNKAREEGMVR